MSRRLVGSLAWLGILFSRAHAQTGAPAPGAVQAQFDSAYFAWQDGDYPSALQRLERILTGPDAPAFLEPVALLTGELYQAAMLAPDGKTPQWSRDGRVAAFTTLAGSVRTVRLVSFASGTPKELASFAGFGLAFSPARDEAAYLAVEETAVLKAARAELDRLTGARDFRGAQQQRQEIARLERAGARIRVRDLGTGKERGVAAPGVAILSLAYGHGGTLYLNANQGLPGRSDVYALGGTGPRAITDTPGFKLLVGATATHVVFTDGSTISVKNLVSGETGEFAGTAATLSADGSTLAYLSGAEADNTVNVYALATGATRVVRRTPLPLANPALSPDGDRVAYQMMPREDWEIYVVSRDGTDEVRLTRDVQDDLLSGFVGNGRVLGLKGEQRHRRSYIYDVATRSQTRLFHNNTVRTIAPEYEWAVSPDASRVLIVADRDGDTVSPERGVYLTDLTRKVSAAQVLERVRAGLAAETDLRSRGERMFAGLAAAVRPIVADVSAARVYHHLNTMFQWDSRWMALPGNQKAIEYFVAQLRSWGYEPEVQWFEPRPGVRTANVIATLKGTRYPDRIYVISSHFDSAQEGPGMDDNGTGTTALLEAARVLAQRPQPATIKFAFLTGEEAGTLGSREFIRRAVAAGDKISGVLNNDMGGWMEDGRLDDTIRYSSAYLRDLQHAAAFLFTGLITYDSKYYRGTDAGPFYEAYGEIVSGIGGYPILASPHYHEPHDALETVSPQLIAEISKTTVASIVLMAQQPELPKPAS